MWPFTQIAQAWQNYCEQARIASEKKACDKLAADEQYRRIADERISADIAVMEQAFAWLTTEYGYHGQEDGDRRSYYGAIYTRDWVIVQIGLDSVEHELLIQIRDNTLERFIPYSRTDVSLYAAEGLNLERIIAVRQPAEKIRTKVSSDDFLTKNLPRYAALLRQYADDILHGDKEQFHAVIREVMRRKL